MQIGFRKARIACHVCRRLLRGNGPHPLLWVAAVPCGSCTGMQYEGSSFCLRRMSMIVLQHSMKPFGVGGRSCLIAWCSSAKW